MSTLTDLESQILDELGEASTPEVWTGETDLREALYDALDECAMIGPFFTTSIMIPLRDDRAFYAMEADGAFPLYVRRAKLWETDRRLKPISLIKLRAKDERFLLSRGSPIRYCPLASDLILFYPAPAADGDSVKVDVVCTYAHSTHHREFVTIREELEAALIHYGKYHKLFQVKGNMQDALEEYQEYLRALGMFKELKSHAHALRVVRFQHGENTRFGAVDG